MFELPTTNPLASAIEWIVAVATGSLAVILCTLAIAVVGVLMLGGRLPMREGARVIIGCFVLLGAPVIAAALMGLAKPPGVQVDQPNSEPQESPRAELPASNYDPYAGASLRRD